MVIRADGKVRTTSWTFHGPHQADPHPKRSTGVAPQGRQSVIDKIHATSARHARNQALLQAGLSPSDWHILFQSLIEAESAYDPQARSPKGAFGLGQLMPATARVLGVDRTDPAQNLEGAARYLLEQLATFQDIDLALAAYNAGPGRVQEYGGVPPFSETRTYIARIHKIRHRLSGQPVEQPVVRVSTRNEPRAPVVIDLH